MEHTALHKNIPVVQDKLEQFNLVSIDKNLRQTVHTVKETQRAHEASMLCQ